MVRYTFVKPWLAPTVAAYYATLLIIVLTVVDDRHAVTVMADNCFSGSISMSFSQSASGSDGGFNCTDGETCCGDHQAPFAWTLPWISAA